MRLQLFDDQDLKQIEEAVARAVTRGLISGFKAIIDRGYFQALQPAAPEPRAAEPVRAAEPTRVAQPAPQPVVEPPATPVEARAPREAPAPAPAPTAAPEPAPAPEPVARAQEPPRPAPEKQRKKREVIDLRKFIRTVPARPEGFITTDEALRQGIVGGPKEAAAVQLRQWITKKEVEAVIVNGYGTPTKGLPGRLCVNKASVIAREQRRAANSASGRGGWSSGRRSEHHAAA